MKVAQSASRSYVFVLGEHSQQCASGGLTSNFAHCCAEGQGQLP